MGVGFGDIASILGGAALGAISPGAGNAFAGAVQDWKNANARAEQDARNAVVKAREDSRWARQQEVWDRDRLREADYDVEKAWTDKVRANTERDWARGEAEEREDAEEQEKLRRDQKTSRDRSMGHSQWNAYVAANPGAVGRMEADSFTESKSFNRWLSGSSNAQAAQAVAQAEELKWKTAYDGMISTPEGMQFMTDNPHLAPLGYQKIVEEFHARKKKQAGKAEDPLDTEMTYQQDRLELQQQLQDLEKEKKQEIEDSETPEAAAQIAATYDAQIASVKEMMGLLDNKWMAFARTPFTPGSSTKPIDETVSSHPSMKAPQTDDTEAIRNQALRDAGVIE